MEKTQGLAKRGEEITLSVLNTVQNQASATFSRQQTFSGSAAYPLVDLDRRAGGCDSWSQARHRLSLA
jgi:hypothetical protein